MYDVQNQQPHEFILADLRKMHMIFFQRIYFHTWIFRLGNKQQLIFVDFWACLGRQLWTTRCGIENASVEPRYRKHGSCSSFSRFFCCVWPKRSSRPQGVWHDCWICFAANRPSFSSVEKELSICNPILSMLLACINTSKSFISSRNPVPPIIQSPLTAAFNQAN